MFSQTPKEEIKKLKFFETVKTENILKHLQVFQDIALKHNNSRSAEFGYNETSKYILNQLSSSNGWFEVTIQPFEIEEYITLKEPSFSSSLLNFKFETDFNQLSYSGSGDWKNLTIQRIGNKGCKPEDYTNIKNDLFVIQRGLCTFFEKVQLAIQFGAKAVIIQNESSGLVAGTLGKLVSIPTFSVSSTFIFPNSTFNVFSFNEIKKQPTFNIIAETVQGNPNEIIVVGSHLDSVSSMKDFYLISRGTWIK
jgi:hypothetical protein